MFYRKYRPRNFSEVFGNENVIKSLQNSIAKKDLGHAIMLYGSRGTGKTSTARLIAKGLACENYSKNNDACLECESCKLMQQGKYIDLIEIDAASNNGVENIRDLNDRVALSPTYGKFKFYIIDEVHMLSKGAFNALLKTLEEPPRNTYFVLATTEPEKVIDTIRSRCQQFEIKRATKKDLVSKLSYIAEQEGVEIAQKDLEKIASASKGGYRDAETFLEQVIVGGLTVDAVLNTTGLDYTIQLFETLKKQSIKDAIELVNTVNSSGKNLENWNKEILYYLRQVILIKNNLSDLVELDDVYVEKASMQQDYFTTGNILKCLRAFNLSLEYFKVSYIPTLPLETAILEILNDNTSSSTLVASAPKNIPPKVDTKPSVKNQIIDTNVLTTDSSLSEVDLLDEFDLDVKNKDVESVVIEELPKQVVSRDNFSWADFLSRVEEKRPTLSFTLNNCKYVGFDNNTLIVQANYVFHKERLEITATKTLLSSILSEMLGEKCGLSCLVSKKSNEGLTDKNVAYVTIKSDEVVMSAPKNSKEDEFAIPANDPNFISSPLSDNAEQTGSGDALDDFSGDFKV